MPFRWAAPGTPDAVVADTGLAQQFPTRVDAEAWLTASFEELADAGVDQVALMEDDHVVYGPMSLHA